MPPASGGCRRAALLVLSTLAAMVAPGAAEDAGEAASPPPLFAHYMPWYADRDTSGDWGYHWTRNARDPDEFRWDGRRRIASWHDPLIGPYDSRDPDALECQVLLLKLAGIEGVIVDWYGVSDFRDYAPIQESTRALVPWLEKAGLQLAICYEDQTLKHRVEGGHLAADEAVAAGLEDLTWLEEHFFPLDFYARHEDRPILLVFGPQYCEPEQWTALRKGLESDPRIFGLPYAAEKIGGEAGVFEWPPVEGGRRLAPDQWRKGLEAMAAKAGPDRPLIPLVFPGFRDYYAQAGLHESYGFIDHRDGATFAETLDRALATRAPLIQIATWNDYGEGTVIEPTWQHGYRYLEQVQARVLGNDAEPADLRLPVRLRQLRQRTAGDEEATALLDEASSHLFAGEPAEARAVLDRVRDRAGEQPATFPGNPAQADPDYRLITNLPYRPEAGSDYARRRCQIDLYLPARAKDFPTVVWFHGGGISAGHRSIPIPLRNRGIAVASATYRLSPKVQAPAYLEDAAAAVAWVFANIADYGGSPHAVFVSGHSAGGYLASMVGLDRRWLAAHKIDADRIAGVIPFSGHTITHFTVRKERGIPGSRPLVDEWAPLYHVRSGAPPFLAITGDRELELMGRWEENAYFVSMMENAGHEETALRELQGFDHGDMPEPAFPLLVDFVFDNVGGE